MISSLWIMTNASQSAVQDEEELEQEQAEAEGLGSEEEGAEAMEEDEGMPGTDLAVYGAYLNCQVPGSSRSVVCCC